jgi:RND family efflux transporter MFP subunit
MLFIVLMLASACQGDISQEKEIAYSVETKTATTEKLDKRIELPAIVGYQNLRHLSFGQGGTIDQITVEEGEYVSSGTNLATLSLENYNTLLTQAGSNQNSARQQYVQAQSNATFVAQQLDNYSMLYQQGAVSKYELDQVQLNFDLARSNLEVSRQQKLKAEDYYQYLVDTDNDYRIISESDARVAYVHYDIGERVGAGTPVISIADEGTHLMAQVDKAVVDGIQVGDIFILDDTTCVVVEIATNPDPITLEYEIVFKTEEALRTGESITLSKSLESYEGIVVPITAILGDNPGYYLYLAEENRAVKRSISISQVVNQYVVIEGVEVGESIVCSGSKLIKENDLLNVISSDE